MEKRVIAAKDMAKKAPHKYQKDASKNKSPGERVYAVDLKKVILLPEFPKNKDHIFSKSFGIRLVSRFGMIFREWQ